MSGRSSVGGGRPLRALVIVIALVCGTLSGFSSTHAARAADLGKFRPGNIISDAVFYDSGTMTVSKIQSFFESKVPACSAGYTCLTTYRESTSSKAADGTCGAYSGATAETAAAIVYKVAKACRINPQVLIVTLQKEQGLVTSSSPTLSKWQRAMGYACPDTADCDTKYFGFFNQVYWGAWQLIRYGISSTFTWYPVGKTTYVRYHPNSACGSAPVLIENKATAALYYYTPYQPNAASLAAGYGASSDPCASYGNRNFYNYFTDWFGTPTPSGIAAIDAKYEAVGGAATLGAATTGYNRVTANGGGYVRGYERGAIAWSSSGGVHVVSGPIREVFNEQGGLTGRLGWPTTDVNRLSAHGVGGELQGFRGGAIVERPAGGHVVVEGAIRGHLGALGGIPGPLGWPTAMQSCPSTTTCTQPFQFAILTSDAGVRRLTVPAIDDRANGDTDLGDPTSAPAAYTSNGGGFVRAFSRGAIAYNPTHGAFAISGDIRTAYNARGGIAGSLGWPTSEQSCGTAGCNQTFQGGTLLVDPSGAVSTMDGVIGAAWAASGGADGPLGEPIGSTVRTGAGGGGLVQAFESGAITRSDRTPAVILVEPFRSSFNARGGLGGALGWPATSAVDYGVNGGGSVQGFERGALTTTDDARVIALRGAVRERYAAMGGIGGTLGWPTTEERGISADGGGTVQGFQSGAIAASRFGAYALQGPIRERYGAMGGITGAAGWPTTGERELDVSGGGTVQGFRGAAITYRDGYGAIAVSGTLRAFYNAQGGLGGPLGWPTAELDCDASGCVQTFDGGAIVGTESTGWRVR